MLNRRSMLFNVVTLTINSNVTSTITIGGEVFTNVTTASKRFKQGTETSYKVEASGYYSKSGTVTMSSNANLDVSLSLAVVAFTVTSNVSATITINGDTSTSVTTKSVNVNVGSNVTWSVAADKYATQSGTQSNVTSDVTKSITLVYNGVTSICTARYIWCTDGSFVDPAKFSSSGKTAYGYALSSTTVVRITRSTGMAWAPSSSVFYTTNFTGAQSLTNGVANSNYLKSYSGYSSSNCPAVYYACTQTNGGKTSYMPARDELSTLYTSIMSGNMKSDLTTAGIYESCNYRTASSDSSTGWYWIWSSSQYSYPSNRAWCVDYGGNQYYDEKLDTRTCVVPFFAF